MLGCPAIRKSNREQNSPMCIASVVGKRVGQFEGCGTVNRVLWQFVQEVAALWSIPRYAAVFRSGRDAQTHALRSIWLRLPQNWGSAGAKPAPAEKGLPSFVHHGLTELAPPASSLSEATTFLAGHNHCSSTPNDYHARIADQSFI